MRKRNYIIGLIILGIVIAGGVSWYLFSPLFLENRVDEAFPFELPADEEIANMDDEQRKALEEEFIEAVPDESVVLDLSQRQQEQVEAEVQKAADAVMMEKSMDDPMPDSVEEQPVVLAAGSFTGADSFHQGSGAADLFRLPDGTTLLRFESFEVTNGPELHVYLSQHPSPSNRTEVGENYLDLGELKGNVGNQNYEVPGDVDLSLYQSVVIYCVPFHVVFATATLG